MEDTGKKSNWDELVRDLGAESLPAADPPIAPLGGNEPPAESRVRTRDKPAAPVRPKATAKDWDNLAMGLGIEVPPAPETPPPPRPTPSAETEAAVPAREVSQRQRKERPPRRKENASGTQARQQPQADRSAPRETPRFEPAESASEPSMESEPQSTEPKQPGGAVSLWHKIFGSPEQQSQRIADVQREAESEAIRREVTHSRQTDWDSVEDAELVVEREEKEVREEWVDESVEISRGDADIDDEPAEAKTEDSRRDRSRRRRRGGRGRRSKRDGSTEGSTEQPSDREDSEELGERRERSDRGRRRGRTRSRRDDDPWQGDRRIPVDEGEILDDVMADDEDNQDEDVDSDLSSPSDDAGGRVSKIGGRNIPAWDEAIGIIVELNMQSRSERRQSSRTSRGGSGSSRGGRGRRRRGGRSRGGGGERGSNGSGESEG